MAGLADVRLQVLIRLPERHWFPALVPGDNWITAIRVKGIKIVWPQGA